MRIKHVDFYGRWAVLRLSNGNSIRVPNPVGWRLVNQYGMEFVQ